jgi:hypothetical protein
MKAFLRLAALTAAAGTLLVRAGATPGEKEEAVSM